MIRFRNVVKMTAEGNRVINDVSFSIREQEHVEFSGAGKSRAMLLKLVAGMDKPDSGSVVVQDMALQDMNDHSLANFRNRAFGLVQGEPCFLPTLCALENIALPLTIRGIASSERERRAREQMESLTIGYLAKARPQGLSAYEKRLVSVARALITRPKILLLDEMDADLSAAEADRLTAHLHAVLQTGGYTILRFQESENPRLKADIRYRLSHGTIQEVDG